MSEYVGSYAQRLAWLTGFQGSAGTAAVLPEDAAIFVDGRYTIQVRQQVSPTEWSYQSVPETSVSKWLQENAPNGARIGYDPWLHTAEWVKQATKSRAAKARAGRGQAQPDRCRLGGRPEPGGAASLDPANM
jgi:Xaa-Pro aminopeptidase